MARPAEGWKLKWPHGSEVAHVRFTHLGIRYELSTGERDPERAAKEAATLYAETISGRRSRKRVIVSGAKLDELIAQWIEDFEADHDKRTAREYFFVARAHWLPRWSKLEEITDASIADYTRAALRRVQRVSVRKELSALRGFLSWCVEKRLLVSLPAIAPPTARVTGVRATMRKREPVPLTPADVERILEALPERSRALPVRDYVTVLWETGLRPATVARLSSPEHYRPRARTLRIARELDKGRFDRVLDLSARAIAALTRSASHGPIFGRIDCRVSLRDAAIAALGKKRGEHVTVYDLRHARITAWLSDSDRKSVV